MKLSIFGIALFLLHLFMADGLHAQATIHGTTVESNTRTLLAGVHIVSEGRISGAVSDSKGRFSITVRDLPVHLSFSMVGYESLKITIESANDPVSVSLSPAQIDLNPLVVTANRELQPRSEAAVSISAISADQLLASQPDMLYQVFNQVAGVHMVNLGNDQHKLSIRQPFTNKAYYLFMEDGIAFRPTGIFNPNAMLDANLASSERIEILRGPSSSVYGGNAVAGSINFITKDPFNRTPSSLSIRRDNYGYVRGDISTTWVKNRVGVSIDGFVAKQRDSWYDHSDYDRVAFTARADVHVSEKTLVENTLSFSHLDTDTNGALDSLSYASRGFNSQHTFSYREMTSMRARSTLRHTWSSGTQSSVSIFARNNSMDQLPYWRVRSVRGNSSKATGETNSQAFWSLGGVGQHDVKLDFGNTVIKTGFSLDVSPSTYQANWIDVNRDAEGKYASFTSPDSLLSDYSAALFNSALFVQAESRPWKELKASVSLRYDRIQYDFDNQLSSTSFSGAPDETTSFDHVSPRFGLTYDFGKGRGIYANTAFGFAPPEINELYHGVTIPSLSPATFTSIETGGWSVFAGGKGYVDISVYSMKGQNEIIPIVSPAGSFLNQNAGETRHYGIEYALILSPVRDWTLRYSGANSVHDFVEFIDFNVDQSGNEMAFSPNWTANAELTYSPTFVSGLSLSAEWAHVGPYFMDNSNSAEYEGYDLVNLRVRYSRARVSVWTHVQNVFDTLYATNAAHYAWGTTYNVGQVRSFLIGATYRF